MAAPQDDRESRHVYIVDDDKFVRTALVRGLEQLGYDAHQFASAREFLESAVRFRPGVIVIDMLMSGATGIELQARLRDEGWDLPVVFISGESSVSQSITAMRQGALDFLVKPFDFHRLADVLAQGIAQDARRMQALARQEACRRALAVLKARELEAFFFLAKGYSYRELMVAMGIGQPTAKQYRAAVMRKLKFASLAELIKFHEDLVAPGP